MLHIHPTCKTSFFEVSEEVFSRISNISNMSQRTVYWFSVQTTCP